MSQTTINTPLRDAMYAMALAQPVPDAELLDEFVRRYPEHADALTTFAIDLAVDALLHGDEDEDFTPTSPVVVSPIVSRVMSRFQNGLFELSHPPAPEQRPDVGVQSHRPVRNPFAGLDRAEFRGLATRLDVTAVLLTKLRDRHIDPETIPDRFSRYVADEMKEEFDVLDAHLCAPPAANPQHQYFKADGKPNIHARQTFEQAVRSSRLSEDQQRRLLSLRD